MPEQQLADQERLVAPAALRAKAGFAKTHGRPMPLMFPDDGPDEDVEPGTFVPRPTEAAKSEQA